METINVKTSQHIDIDYPVAGVGERLAASLLDMAMFIVFAFAIAIFASLLRHSFSELTNNILLIIAGACFVFYSLLLEIFMNGQTVGKKILKIKVISIDGGQPSIGQYAIRWLFRLLDVYTTGVIGVISIAVSDKRQRVGDVVAGTTLIKTTLSTHIGHIAFHTQEDYTPIFNSVDLLTDRDIELVHEVLETYYKTHNHELIYMATAKVNEILHLTLPQGMNELVFLQTIVKDYSYLTSRD